MAAMAEETNIVMALLAQAVDVNQTFLTISNQVNQVVYSLLIECLIKCTTNRTYNRLKNFSDKRDYGACY